MINTKNFLLIVLTCLFVFIIGTWILIGVINKQGKKEIGEFISTINLTTLQSIHLWAERHYTVVKQEADNYSPLINELVTQKITNSASLGSSIRTQLSALVDLDDYTGYAILNRNNTNLSSYGVDWIDKRDILYEQNKFLEKIWKGQTSISNPFYVKKTPNDTFLRMLIGSPVKDDSGTIVAILLISIDPSMNFTKIFKHGRIGNSGENYAIDKMGRLLSKSRFTNQLEEIGLIKNEENEILNSSVRVLNTALFKNKKTFFSAPVVLSDVDSHYFTKVSGMNLDGYPNYREINVIGVWTWDQELDIGIVTELDADEAFKVFYRIQSSIMILFFIWIITFFLVSAIYYYWFKDLNHKEETYADLFNYSPLGIYKTTPDGEILMANQTLLDMMGYNSLSDVQVRNLEKEGYSEESPVTRQEFKERIEKEGIVKGIEGNWKTREGEILYVRENARVVRDKNGKTLYYEGTVEDISEKKKAEFELESQKEFLKKIIDISPNLVFVKDWNGCFTLVNKKMAKLFGLSVEEMLGKTELDINPNKKEAEKFLKDDREVMKSLKAKVIHEEFYYDKYNEQEHWFHTTKVPLIPSNGELSQVLVVATDITRQKQTEETIRQIKDRLQLATQTANIGIWDLNIATNKLIWDEAMYSLYGITRDTFSGVYEAWEAGLHPDDRDRAENELQMALRGEKKFDTVFRVLWPDNSVHYLKAFGLVQRNDKGEPIRMLGTNWDISLLVEAKKEIEKKNESLLELDKAKSDFLQIISHEIMTPLNGILGFTNILRNSVDSDELLLFVESLEESANRLHQFSNNAVLVTSLKLGRRKLNLNKVFIKPMLDSLVHSFSKQTKSNNIKILNEVPTNTHFLIDGDLILICFKNIIDNAIKFSPKNSTILISLSSYNTIEVIDEGNGFSNAALSNLFKLFSPGEKHIDQNEGMGLALSNLIAKVHSGEISVKNLKPKGASVNVKFPYENLN
ncbi:PAS domain S-box protein [Ancylomarina sp. DW003]|nr:PAS domain S-box protein [Ancylomarina sp. DW003]MDE5423085.1 PAS domain S-box protein [Ancylomarina sp. DW003]